MERAKRLELIRVLLQLLSNELDYFKGCDADAPGDAPARGEAER
jgi:hypothetical protein